MATLLAIANGDLTSATTWGLVDATSLLDSQANNTALTTSLVASQTFTPGVITTDGVALKVASRSNSPTGTMIVDLAIAGVQVPGSEVTINVSDLPSWSDSPSTTLCGIGWTFFKFPSPLLLVALTAYTVRARTTTAAQVNLFRNATVGNWSRMLRTTTTQAPVAADRMFICGEWTAAATKTDRTVTMDSTVATDYGDATTGLVATFGISKGGTLNYGTTAVTNYILRISGSMNVWREGTLNIGTVGTEIPRNSSAVLEFDAVASNQFGCRVFGNNSGQGLSRTIGKNIQYCLLNTDEAIGQTILGVETDTGWLSSDDIALASTSRTATQRETRALSVNATATDLTVSSGLTNAHSGTSPTQAEIILLSRNVVIRSTSSTFMAYFEMYQDSVIDFDWVQFKSLSGTTFQLTSYHNQIALGSIAINFCSFWECVGDGLNLAPSQGEWIGTITNCGFYLVGTGAGNWGIDFNKECNNTIVLSNIVIIGTCAGGGIQIFNGIGPLSTIDNIRISSCNGNGFSITPPSAASVAARQSLLNNPIYNNFNIHSNAAIGLIVSSAIGLTLDTGYIWRNNFTSGVVINNSTNDYISDNIKFINYIVFGNLTTNFIFGLGGSTGLVSLVNCLIAGDTSFATLTGISLRGTGPYIVNNCNLGATSGIFVPHTTDISYGNYIAAAENIPMADLTMVDTLLNSAIKISPISGAVSLWAVKQQFVNQVPNVNQVEYTLRGVTSREDIIYRTEAPSEKLTPALQSSNLVLTSGVKLIGVYIGETASVSTYVRKDSSYNGNAPRLVVKANPSIGLNNDLVLDSMIGPVDTWEQLSGVISPVATADGVYEIYVDCTGTAGNIYVDDWVGATS